MNAFRIPAKESDLCKGCAEGKSTSKSYPQSSSRAKEPLELIHSDLKEFPTIFYRQYKYAVIFYDDYTSFAWHKNLKYKHKTYAAFKQFKAMVELKTKQKIKIFHIDRGGEFFSDQFQNFLSECGIEVQTSASYTHQQNGCAERII